MFDGLSNAFKKVCGRMRFHKNFDVLEYGLLGNKESKNRFARRFFDVSVQSTGVY